MYLLTPLSRGLKSFMIKVQVVYANTEKQTVLDIAVPEKTTVQAAIEQSKISEQFSEINLSENKIGIYGELVSLETLVSENDRIEIYRALIIDPMEARRLRAQKSKS